MHKKIIFLNFIIYLFYILIEVSTSSSPLRPSSNNSLLPLPQTLHPPLLHFLHQRIDLHDSVLVLCAIQLLDS